MDAQAEKLRQKFFLRVVASIITAVSLAVITGVMLWITVGAGVLSQEARVLLGIFITLLSYALGQLFGVVVILGKNGISRNGNGSGGG